MLLALFGLGMAIHYDAPFYVFLVGYICVLLS